MCIQIGREWGSRISDAVPDTVVTLLPLGWGYSVPAYVGAAAAGLGQPTLGWGTCIHQAGHWWCWMAVKCQRVRGDTTRCSCDPRVDLGGLPMCGLDFNCLLNSNQSSHVWEVSSFLAWMLCRRRVIITLHCVVAVLHLGKQFVFAVACSMALCCISSAN